MTLSKANLVQPQGLTTIERDLLTLAGADSGRLIYNETTNTLQQWTGAAWIDVLNTNSTLDATKLSGVVDGALINNLDAVKLTGQIVNTQIAAMDAAKLTGIADGGTY